MLLAILLSLSLAQDESEKPYVPIHKIEFQLTLKRADETWQFIIEGTSDLPDDVLLRGRVYTLEEVDDFRGGKRIDEEEIATRFDQSWHKFRLKDGTIHEIVFESRRKPYSLPYRAKIFYKPDDQEDDVRGRVRDKQDFVVFADLQKDSAPSDGRDPGLEKELTETLKELSAELDEISKLFKEFKSAYLEQQKKYEAKAWETWLRGWLGRVTVISDRNDERWLMWSVWLERQGKFRIEAFCDRFRYLADTCTEALKGDPEASQHLQSRFESFVVAFDEAREVLGMETPFDPDAVGEELSLYTAVMNRFREVVVSRDRDAWAKEGESLRRRARASLLKLSTQKLLPRRGYERILAISELFLKMHESASRFLEDRGDAQVQKQLLALLEEHDAKLRDFRQYAGTK